MEKKQALLLGCVADDFTGASDAASFLVNQGIPTLLCNGLPAGELSLEGCGAVVIALKTRSVEPELAVRETLDALRFLEHTGARQLYIKYCSTFDSTPKGNIGPVVDAAMEEFGVPYTLLCPSLPVNGRTVENGRLYVNGEPLDQSPMKNHPLNPMWDSEIANLMRPQGKYPCVILTGAELDNSSELLLEEMERRVKASGRCYLVPDYTGAAQGKRIAEIWGGWKLLTGGSGLLEHLADRYINQGEIAAGSLPASGTKGRGIIFSGSCSKATGEQIACFREGGGAAIPVEAKALLSGDCTVDSLWEVAKKQDELLLYSTGAELDASQRDGEKAAEMLEKTFASLAGKALEEGYTRIVVAGGETSGAVTLALGFNAFLIGESIAPGVPVMVPTPRQDVRLVLKSGNFGQRDFFRRALEKTKEGK